MRVIPNKINQNGNNEPNNTTVNAGEVRSPYDELNNVLALANIEPGGLDPDYEDLEKDQVAKSIDLIAKQGMIFNVANFDSATNTFTLKRKISNSIRNSVILDLEKFVFQTTALVTFSTGKLKLNFIILNDDDSVAMNVATGDFTSGSTIANGSILECYYIGANNVVRLNGNVIPPKEDLNFEVYPFYFNTETPGQLTPDPKDNVKRLWTQGIPVNDDIENVAIVGVLNLAPDVWSQIADANFRVEITLQTTGRKYKKQNIQLWLPNDLWDSKPIGVNSFAKRGNVDIQVLNSPGYRIYSKLNPLVYGASSSQTVPISHTQTCTEAEMLLKYDVGSIFTSIYYCFEFTIINHYVGN